MATDDEAVFLELLHRLKGALDEARVMTLAGCLATDLMWICGGEDFTNWLKAQCHFPVSDKAQERRSSDGAVKYQTQLFDCRVFGVRYALDKEIPKYEVRITVLDIIQGRTHIHTLRC